jgi:hypothetical protein
MTWWIKGKNKVLPTYKTEIILDFMGNKNEKQRKFICILIIL